MRFLRRHRHKAAASVALAVVAAAWLHPGIEARDATIAHASPVPASDLATLLDQVNVVDRIDRVPGYERSCRKSAACVFGPAWNDPTDATGCDARNRLLARDLNDVAFKEGTQNCKVVAGWLQDPYTGERVELADVEADHVVSLSRAWDAGAWQWDPLQRQIFANDLRELRAVSGSINGSKSDHSLDEWLPPNPKLKCAYVIQYLDVSVIYALPITHSERNAAIAACAQ